MSTLWLSRGLWCNEFSCDPPSFWKISYVSYSKSLTHALDLAGSLSKKYMSGWTSTRPNMARTRCCAWQIKGNLPVILLHRTQPQTLTSKTIIQRGEPNISGLTTFLSKSNHENVTISSFHLVVRDSQVWPNEATSRLVKKGCQGQGRSKCPGPTLVGCHLSYRTLTLDDGQ